ncbi:gastric triacylglycerol lipase-like [Macrotis lagotis]|uniref:gastric triacylglycerol lipase-like n=1 Tax=Macrotis lagotis TaxID=92651 RepID=UPI003D68438E
MWILVLASFTIQALGTECFLYPIIKPTNPEVFMNVSEIIRRWDYPVEEYEVVTDDFYILTLIRIPYGRMNKNLSAQRPVVFLQHGFLTSSISWISNIPNNSFAFILADAGFDVWLGNSRGSTYGLKHVFLSTNSRRYWAFSFDEAARYDIPASIDFVVKKTGQKLFYVGHSQGALLGFLAFSTLPKLNQHVKFFYALAPAYFFQQIKSIPFLLLLNMPRPVLTSLLGDKDFLPETNLNKILATKICNNRLTDILCIKFIFSLSGFDTENLNRSRLDVYLSHNPAGSSIQNLLHYSQEYFAIRKVLPAFDWGSPQENLIHYNQTNPPIYDLSTMQLPTAVWSGLQDLLADPEDVSNLIPLIPNLIYHKILPTFDHLAFILGVNAPEFVYYEIIEMMREIS